ncbi:MAG: hypothetical protein IH830_10115 [Planctomycetes bacterium]|nr:hypothetical protein [Planctomycetota bacterium]
MRLKTAVHEGKSDSDYTLAMDIANRNDPGAIPTLIGLIDSDNSQATIYAIGWYALNPLTGVRYDGTHHGPWWRKWWEANKSRFPERVQALPIPDLPKTAEGKAFAKDPPDLASIILEPTLDDLLQRLTRQVRDGDHPGISDTARWLGEFGNPRAIPTLIGIIDADNSYVTVYGIGWSALNPLTGVRYDASHHGPWWRKWWKANRERFPQDVQALAIPDLPKTAQGKAFAKDPPDPTSIILKPTLDDLLQRLTRQVRDGDHPGISGTAPWIGEFGNPRAIPTLIGIIDADNSFVTVNGIGWFALSPLTGVRYDGTHHGPWWRKWWKANKERFPQDVQALAIPDLPKTAEGKAFAKDPPDPASIILEPTLDDLLQRLTRQVRDGDHPGISDTAPWIGEFENPRAIPTLIALIEKDNTYDTVYGIGWFGLNPLTGVDYDESHDGAWWRAWWQQNKAEYADRMNRADEPPSGNLRVPRHLRPVIDAEDVAHIPAQDLRAGGDQDKRYLLIGPHPDTPTPANGFRLLIVMPGGHGGPDFHPFIKRIYKNVLSNDYLLAQVVAPEWNPNQGRSLVWPTETNRWPGMRFSTEELINAVIGDIEQKHKLDAGYLFTLTWSSSGPAAYAISLQPDTRVTGSFVAMSVFKPAELPPLDRAAGHPYFILHSPQDFIPIRMAEEARDMLGKNEAVVQLVTYEGGHGWRGDVYGNLRRGIRWLEEHRRAAGSGTPR